MLLILSAAVEEDIPPRYRQRRHPPQISTDVEALLIPNVIAVIFAAVDSVYAARSIINTVINEAENALNHPVESLNLEEIYDGTVWLSPVISE